VVVHPQSVVHSMVEFVDGSVLAQLGFPTMELPILYALTHPERLEDAGTRRFDPVAASGLTFEPVDIQRFPAFQLGVDAGRAGGTAPAAFNAANEVAVEGFLNGSVRFTAIPEVIASVLDAHEPCAADSLEAVVAADRQARVNAEAALRRLC
jgi:1-deoxy-D-xylulose-5-phosphate reductoisomerase